MVRGKKGRKSVAKTQANENPQVQDVSGDMQKKRTRFSIIDYILVCLFFIVFCYLQQFVAIKMLGGEQFEKESLSFFFGTMWKGFLVVAFIAWLIDYFSRDIEEEDTA